MVVGKRVFSVVMLTILLTSMLASLSFSIEGFVHLSTAMTMQEVGILSEAPPTEWSKTYGGTNDEWAYSVVQTADGGYALAGQTYSYGTGSEDFWLVKTDANGNMQWSKTYGGTNWDSAYSIVQTGDGGYALAGETASHIYGKTEAWLVKTDSSGNMQWSQTYGMSVAIDVFAYSVAQTSEGGYALAGATWNLILGDPNYGTSDFWLAKTDANGNMQWNETYGGTVNEYAYSLVQTTDGGYALAGATNSFGAGAYDFWLVKVGSDLPPPTYSLTITASAGGTTSPSPGTYQYSKGEVATVIAMQQSEYGFDHWELDTVNVGSANPYSVTMNTAHTLRAVFGAASSQPPIAMFFYSPMPFDPVVGEEMEFDASFSKGAISYRWDLGDGHIISTSDTRIQHSYITSGTYHVTLTAINSNGQADISRTITVKKPPVILVHGFQSFDDYDEEEIWRVMRDSLSSSGFTVYVSHYA